MSPDTAGCPDLGFVTTFVSACLKRKPFFSCIPNQGPVGEEQERMEAGRHWAEPARTWRRRTSFQVMIKQSQREKRSHVPGADGETTSGDSIRDLVGK